MYLFSIVLLSINYIPIREPIIKEYKIIDAYSHRRKNGNNAYFVKIKWKKKPMELRIFLKHKESIFDKKKIILETRKGLLGWQVIKNRELQ